MIKKLLLSALLTILLCVSITAQSSSNTATRRVWFGTANPSTCQPTGTNLFYRSDTGTLLTCTASNVWTALAGGASSPIFSTPVTFNSTANSLGQNAISSSSAGLNTVETIVVKSTAAIGANRLIVGSTIRITLLGTCTSSATNTSTFNIRIGTAGTTADTLVFTAVLAAGAASGTNIPFKAVLELTVRTTGSGTAGTASGYLTLDNQGVTGISTTATQVIKATMTGFDTTINNFIDASYLSAAATTTSTFDVAFIEVVYN